MNRFNTGGPSLRGHRYARILRPALLHGLCAVLMVTSLGVHAQGMSSKMSSMIVPYPAGGPADVTARQIEPALRKSLGEGFVIENLPGASGAIAVERTLNAPKDGHTVLFADPSNIILGPLALSAVRHKPEQLRLVGMASRTPLVLVSGMQLDAGGLNDLLAMSRKAGAAPLNYGSFGAGSLPHLAGEDFALRSQTQMTHIPYKGGAPLLQDLIGGQVQLAFLPVGGNTVDMIRQKKLKAYAVTADQRVARLAEVPTVTEATGIKDFNFEIWGGIYVAKGVPLDAAKRLNKAVNDALQDPDYRRQTEAAGASVGQRMDMAQLEQFFASQVSYFKKLADAIKLVPQ